MITQRKFDPSAVELSNRLVRLRQLPEVDLLRAGITHLRVVIIGWWLGEVELVAESLATAVQLLDTPENDNRSLSEDGMSHAALSSHARALAHLMVGTDQTELWAAAAQVYTAARKELDRASRARLAAGAIICSAMADMEPPQYITLADDFAVSVLDIVSVATDPAEAGQRLYAARDILFAAEPDLELTTLFALLFMRKLGIASLATALHAGYVVNPDLVLSPALEASGWSNQEEAIFVVNTARFEHLSKLLALTGLTRDKDAIPQGDKPEFASWTRHPDLSLEVDWHATSGQQPYLEIRGKGAGRLAAFLKEALGGTARPGPEAALTELLTVPPRAAPANAVAAEARWETLCVAVTSEGVFHDLPGRALVSASLADSDWRVRMVALWAVGHHRISGLAAKAEAAALPKLGYKGLSQDDRRVLLALRDLAAARSAGRSDVIKLCANEGFVAMVASLINAVPERAESRAEALVKALLRRHVSDDDAPVPSAWKIWMGAPSF